MSGRPPRQPRIPDNVSSPALAIGWEFRQRHRWGLIGIAGYLAALALIKLLTLQSGRHINLDTPESFAFVVLLPMTATFIYFLAVFTFGFSGDLAGRQSMYPARAFTLPVSTAALAGWPMLYGTATMAILWMATRLLALWPSGIQVPSVWPAFLAAALLAWTQALMWMPYGLRGLRVMVPVLCLATIDAITLLALQYQASESLMVAILAPQLPLAYLTARYAVARARRGDVPDWRGSFTRRGRIAGRLTNRGRHFASPAGAQAWFEWRQHGRSLPTWVAILLPFELALLFVAGDTPALVFTILAGVVITPPLMAVFAAATVRRAVTPFTATRPLASPALVGAKLKAAIGSTLAAWVLVLATIPLALKWSGRWPMVVSFAHGAADRIGTPRVVVLVLLILSGLIVSTWKQLVQSLYLGLSGRARLIKGSVFVTLALLFLFGPIAQWIMDNTSVQRALWDALPLILAGLVGLKMGAAYWITIRLYRSRLLSDRALVTGAACWCVAVLAVYGVLAWFMGTPIFPRYVLALLAILAIPLARLAAAPLALAGNRHQ